MWLSQSKLLDPAKYSPDLLWLTVECLVLVKYPDFGGGSSSRSFGEQAFPTCSKKKTAVPWFHEYVQKSIRNIFRYISEAGPHSIAFKPTLRWNRGSSNQAEPTMSVSSKIILRNIFTPVQAWVGRGEFGRGTGRSAHLCRALWSLSFSASSPLLTYEFISFVEHVFNSF